MEELDKDKMYWFDYIKEEVKDICDDVDNQEDIDFELLGRRIAEFFNYYEF